MIITFAHYKGGTGKTTSCLSVAGFLAKYGKRVLVVDIDPQANATSGLGINKNTLDGHMFHVMNKRKNIDNIILETGVKNLHLAPSNQELERSKIYSYNKKSDAEILKRALEKIEPYYDFILIDTPPVHGHFIINGMMAADKIIVVLDPGVFALEGIETLQNSFGGFLRKLGLKLNIDMALITRAPGFSLFNRNSIKEIKQEVEEMTNSEVFVLPFSNIIYHTHIWGLPISHFRPKSRIGRLYGKIAEKILNEFEVKKRIDEEILENDKNN